MKGEAYRRAANGRRTAGEEIRRLSVRLKRQGRRYEAAEEENGSRPARPVIAAAAREHGE